MAGGNIKKILVIDGQGGKLGNKLIEALNLKAIKNIEITAIGTNSIATSNMIKAGVNNAATGENSVIVCCRDADIIVGPIGIVIADALIGEVTPEMAKAVGQSKGIKILMPINKCNNIVIGVQDLSFGKLVDLTVEEIISKL